MKVLCFFSQKGGSGKTSLSIHAAVAALDDGMKVVIIDCDPQASATGWGSTRAMDAPFMVQASPSTIRAVLQAAHAEKYDLAILDCPPHASAGISQIIETADYVVLPCQPTALDIAAAGKAVAVIQANRKLFGIVLNRAPLRAPENPQACEVLSQYGTVCPTMIAERRAIARAITGGTAVTEYEADGKAADEIRGMWNWIKKEMK
jgi:chromosome partitioning protein